MRSQNTSNQPKASEVKFTKGINIPPQPTIPKMPPVQPPKRTT